MSCLEAHVGIYRLLMKGIFDAYILRPFDKKFTFWNSNARSYSGLYSNLSTPMYHCVFTYHQWYVHCLAFDVGPHGPAMTHKCFFKETGRISICLFSYISSHSSHIRAVGGFKIQRGSSNVVGTIWPSNWDTLYLSLILLRPEPQPIFWT